MPPQAPATYAPAPPPHVPARPNRSLIVLAVVLGLAVILAGSYAVGRLTVPTSSGVAAVPANGSLAPVSAAPTPSGSGTSVRVGFMLTGSTLSGHGFTARMPSGWTLAPENGASATDGVIENGANNTLAFFASDPTSAARRCSYVFDGYRVKLGGTVVDLPGVPWASGTAVVKELETKYSSGQEIGLNIYCVDRPGTTSAAILSIADLDHQSTNKAAAEALLASWVWT
jgi:hypothetical protein